MRKVQFNDKGKKKREGLEQVDKLTRKLLQLNIKNDMYVAVYIQLFVLAPIMTENLLLPFCFAVSTITFTSTIAMPSYSRYFSAFIPHNFTCHLCKKPEYCLRTCLTIKEYVQL